MASYDGELVLDSSSPWSGISNHLSSFFIPLPLNFKKQMTLLVKKIQGLQAPHEGTGAGAGVEARAFEGALALALRDPGNVMEGSFGFQQFFLI